MLDVPHELHRAMAMRASRSRGLVFVVHGWTLQSRNPEKDWCSQGRDVPVPLLVNRGTVPLVLLVSHRDAPIELPATVSR